MDQIEIACKSRIVDTVRPPGSKSITNRALICAALADGTSLLRGALDSEDTQVMVESLRQLGIAVEHRKVKHEIQITGCSGTLPVAEADLFVANSGTTIRFLTAMVALGNGRYRLDGIPRMRERPIGDLLDALNQLGGDARSEGGNGCPPVIVQAHGLAGGKVTIAGDISSQYLSGLMMAAPYARSPVTVEVNGELVSRPYIAMTDRVMLDFGVDIDTSDDRRHTKVPTAIYKALEYDIEPDASAASYFWAAAAVTGGRVRVEGLTIKSLQGDVHFTNVLHDMGCSVEVGMHDDNSITVIGRPLKGIDVDMNAISDTVQTLAMVALFAEGPTRIRNVAHNRHKETDRIGDLAREIRKLGATVNEFDDGLEIIPGPLHGAVLDTYNDHRMAMSFAVAGLRIPGVIINDPGCTAKTYPRFFEDWARLGGEA